VNDAKQSMKAFVLAAAAIAEAIRELKEVPSGHLYARVMSRMSLQTYDLIIDRLIGAKLVSRQNHLLKWIGPTLDPKESVNPESQAK
jgi:hypothetical protein